MLCQTCKKRETCRALCRRAENYVSQDEVRLRIGKAPIKLADFWRGNWLEKELMGLGDVGKAEIELGQEEWAIIESLPGLSARERESLHLKYWRGLTESEAAAELKVAIGAYRRYVCRAKAKIGRLTQMVANKQGANFLLTTFKRGNMAGRPLKFNSVKSLRDGAEAYFEECNRTGRPYTISGLALSLGMSRTGLLRYEGRAGYAEVIETAKSRCEAYAEERLLSGRSATGLMFSLKNNFEHWRDKAEAETIQGPIEIRVIDPDDAEG